MSAEARGRQEPRGRALLVLRHAKSACEPGIPTDFDRPLSPRGEEDAPRLGAWLSERGLVPDYVVCSPARRARQTAGLVLGALEADAPPVAHFDERLYGADLSLLLEVLGDTPPEAELVLLVGHNPGLETLLCFLTPDWGKHGDRPKFLPTCTLAHLAILTDWTALSAGEAEVRDMVRPKDL